MERFARSKEPQDVIREATDASLDETNYLQSLDCLDALYTRAGFNEETKFGFLRMEFTKILPVANFAMYHGASDYAQLTRGIKDFEFGTRAFQAGACSKSDAEKLAQKDSDKKMKPPVRPDVRFHNMEAKIDTVADQLSN